MTTAIRVEHLSKSYHLGVHSHSIRDLVNSVGARLIGRRPPAKTGYFQALSDISFEIQTGEIVGVIGRNGAGKSTLLKVLSQIVAPSTGRVELQGRVASLLEVGTGFHPELTGRENVYLNSAILGMSKAEVRRKFDEIVAFAEVDRFIDTPVKRYSSGMYVRLAFAVAAHLESEILIVDEVLAVGDAEFQERCLGKMNDVSRHGRTVMFVSHNVASIRQLTGRCIMLQQGQIAFDGKTDEALSRYIRRGESSEAGLEFDVEHIERPFGGLTHELHMIRLVLLADHRDGFLSNRQLSFQAFLRVRDAVPAFRFAITIFRDDHVAVGSCFSESVTPPGTGGLFSVTVRIPGLPLAAGEFYCAVSVGDTKPQGWELFDSVNEVLRFRVTGGNAGGGYQTWLPGWGAVEFPAIEVGEPESALADDASINENLDAVSLQVGRR